MLVAVLEPFQAAQLRQARIAGKSARGKRQIDLLIGRPWARPRPGCKTDFHRLDAIRRIVQGDFGFKRIFLGVGARRQQMMRQSDPDDAASAVWVCGRQSGFRAIGAGGVRQSTKAVQKAGLSTADQGLSVGENLSKKTGLTAVASPSDCPPRRGGRFCAKPRRVLGNRGKDSRTADRKKVTPSHTVASEYPSWAENRCVHYKPTGDVHNTSVSKSVACDFPLAAGRNAGCGAAPNPEHYLTGVGTR